MKKTAKNISATLLFCMISFLVSHAQYGWIQKASFMGPARHHCTAFSVGSRGYVGTGWNGVVTYDDFYEYDPGTDSWQQIASFPGGPSEDVQSFTIGNKAYAGTWNNMWSYNPATNTWVAIASCPLSISNFSSVAFAMGGKGYICDGYNLVEYNPTGNSWTFKANYPGSAFYYSSATSYNGNGYVFPGGGDFWEYNPTSNMWVQKAMFPGLTRIGPISFPYNGMIYVAIGAEAWTNMLSDVWKFDPAANTWTEVDDFPGLARRFSIGLTIGARCYIANGTNGTNMHDFWEFGSLSGINEPDQGNGNVNIYPDPIQTSATIKIIEQSPDQKYSLTVFDAEGRKVREENFEGGNFIFNRNGLNDGVYFIEIKQGDQLFGRKKILIQ